MVGESPQVESIGEVESSLLWVYKWGISWVGVVLEDIPPVGDGGNSEGAQDTNCHVTYMCICMPCTKLQWGAIGCDILYANYTHEAIYESKLQNSSRSLVGNLLNPRGSHLHSASGTS
jgi:hypothetical protein